jgi:hypothetical protein
MPDTEIRLSKLEQQINELTNIINDLQEQLKLLPDLKRYKQLQQFLQQGDFKGADAETTRIMLDVVNEERDTLTPADVSKFPCNVIQIIDQLWQDYSEQKFGFTVQLKTYYAVGGNIDTIRAQDIKIMREFAQKIGWFDENYESRAGDYDNWDFSLSAPAGCFPAHWWKSPYGLKMVTFFFSRLIACDI